MKVITAAALLALAVSPALAASSSSDTSNPSPYGSTGGNSMGGPGASNAPTDCAPKRCLTWWARISC